MSEAAPSPAPTRVVRPLRAGDEPFLFRAWLKSCRHCERHRHLPAGVYYSDVHDQVERLIEAPVVTVAMAMVAENERLLGFICTERLAGATRVLHYAYVKGPDRRRGVFGELARAVGLDLARPFYYSSHPSMASVMAARYPAAVYRRDVLSLPR